MTWSCSAVAGPILGGVFSCKSSQFDPFDYIYPFAKLAGGDATNPLSWRWACELHNRHPARHQPYQHLSLSKPASLPIWSRHFVSFLARRQATVTLARLLWSILAKVRLYRIVSDDDNVLRPFFVTIGNRRVTLVAGTSCIIVGFSFGTDNGCKLN